MSDAKRRTSIIRFAQVGAAVALGVVALNAVGCNRAYRPPVESVRAQEADSLRKANAAAQAAQRLEGMDQPDAAMAKYEEAIGHYPEMAAAWNNLGRLKMKAGQNMQAAEAFQRAGELSPTDPTPLANLAKLWEDLGHYDDASRWYNEALRRDPSHLESLRRSVLIDTTRTQGDEVTLERIKRALLQETDPWWIDRLKREQNRVRGMIAERAAAGE